MSQYSVCFPRGADRFSVTVVVLANAPAVDEEIINHAADILRKKGEVRADYPVGYIAGVRGRQLLIAEPQRTTAPRFRLHA